MVNLIGAVLLSMSASFVQAQKPLDWGSKQLTLPQAAARLDFKLVTPSGKLLQCEVGWALPYKEASIPGRRILHLEYMMDDGCKINLIQAKHFERKGFNIMANVGPPLSQGLFKSLVKIDYSTTSGTSLLFGTHKGTDVALLAPTSKIKAVFRNLNLK